MIKSDALLSLNAIMSGEAIKTFEFPPSSGNFAPMSPNARET